MTRRQIREQIFQLLFSAAFFSKEELESQLALNMRELCAVSEASGEDVDEPSGVCPDAEASAGACAVADAASDADMAYIASKTRDIVSRLDEIDAQINDFTEGWKTTRMGKTELAILRLAVYEMKYEEEIPVSVAINEAVELAKIYGSERGASFVNGVLAKLA